MFEELTDMQKSIITLHGKNILKACPGSGKTFVVAHKVINDYNNWKEKNKGMAVLSFTNVAKDELLSKICEISGMKTLPYPHFVGTLDSFVIQNIFMPFGQVFMQCSARPSIMDNDFIDRYSKNFWKSECYHNRCNPYDFQIGIDKKVYDNKKNFSNCPFAQKKPCKKFKLNAYSKGYVTYKEALIIATYILENYPNILQLVSSRFPYFVVDEAQDTSEEQMKLLNILFKNGVKDAMLIGDPDQAIYEWRDADPSVFLDIYGNPDWNAYELNENFRCSQNICNATKIFSSLSKPAQAIGTTKEFDLKPLIIKYKKDEKEKIIQWFLDFCSNNEINKSSDNIAVLTRGHAGLVGKNYSQIEDLWQTPITKMLALATYYRSKENIEKTTLLVEKILYYIIFDDKANVADNKEIQKKYSAKEWNYLIFRLSALLPEAIIPLKEWKQQIVDVIKTFVIDNHIECKNEVEIKTKIRVQNVSLKDFLDQPLQDFFADSYKKEYLNTTIHAVKGCTFDAVMLIISSHGKLTSNMINQKEINSEEIRTFYVAATRARKIFVLALPDSVKDKSLIRFPKEHWDYI